MFRALRPAIRREGSSDVSALFPYAAAAIPLFYLPALFYGPRANFAVIDNWRFWIIHLWVEGFFELFATVLVAIMFRQMGLVTTRTATRLVYLDATHFLTGGIVGTGHHWYFTGQGGGRGRRLPAGGALPLAVAAVRALRPAPEPRG